MKKLNSLIFSLLISQSIFAQFEYEPSEKSPFGRPNPNAPEQIKDYQDMIGECNCKSSTRKKDGAWSEQTDMIWRFKYIMNGMAIQDETLKPDNGNSGSIRQFNADSSKWYVHYYTTNNIPKALPAWEGKKEDGKIILYKYQRAPNGMDGFYRLTFYDISKAGYKWIGEWVDKTERVAFSTWKIECKR